MNHITNMEKLLSSLFDYKSIVFWLIWQLFKALQVLESTNTNCGVDCSESSLLNS